MLFNKVTSISSIDLNNLIKKLCDPCIESKYTKIVKYKKMTPMTQKLKEIHADLWIPQNPSSLSERTYISLLLNKFTNKSLILLFQSIDKLFDAFKLWLP